MTHLYSLKGKNVLITGAGGSIGTQIAILFAKAEARTLLLSDVCGSTLSDLHATLRLHVDPSMLGSSAVSSCRLVFRSCDVSNEEEVSRLVAELDQFGGVDVAVNCAGVFPTHLDGDAVGVTTKAWDLTHRVNVLGTWLGCKHAVLSMRRHGKSSGSVINVSSVAALVGSATAQIAYAASKGAVMAMTRELGIVHAKEGYRFNCLCPGPLNNPMVQQYLDSPQADDNNSHVQKGKGTISLGRRERREIHLPQGRFGESVEVASAALFLASDASSFVNSTELVIDGGMTKAFVTPEGPPSNISLENFATANHAKGCPGSESIKN